MSFVHLHLHTEYSIMNATCTARQVFQAAERLGMPAVAITDHLSLSGVPAFLKAARVHPAVKPIIGCEVMVRINGTIHNLTLLAKDLQGYRNLVKILSTAHLGNVRKSSKPAVGRLDLRRYSKGLICLSGYADGESPRLILQGRTEIAEKTALWYKKVFGDDFYLEAVRHPQGGGSAGPQDDYCGQLFSLADKLGVKVVATNDVRFVERDGAEALAAMTFLQTETSPKPAYTGQEYMKDEGEMLSLFPGHPEAVANTCEVAAKVETFDIREDMDIPPFPLSEEQSAKVNGWMRSYSDIIDAGAYDRNGQLRGDTFFANTAFLSHLVFTGAGERYGTPLPPEVKERITHELKTVSAGGVASLFLIIWDYLRWARENGILVGPGRGCSPGSVILYCLGVTEVDPIRHGLLFERFMNPEAHELPDIDVDIDSRERIRVLEYLQDKYGKDYFGLGIVFGVKTKKQLPYDPRLDGLVCKRGINACSVLLGSRPLGETLPVTVCVNARRGRQYPVPMYEVSDCAKMGVLPLDLIGMEDLTYSEDCLRLIEKRTGVRIDLNAIPLDDPETYALYGRGDTDGVFHFDAPDAKHLLRRLKPRCFEDIMMVEVLWRREALDRIPGVIAVRNGRKAPSTGIPVADSLLSGTCGFPLYQEQVMKIAQMVAGFSPNSSDFLRRALLRHDEEALEGFYRLFIEGGSAKDADLEALESIWQSWRDAGRLLFNKSHAACYALISHRIAWLKAHYPDEFAEAFNLNIN